MSPIVKYLYLHCLNLSKVIYWQFMILLKQQFNPTIQINQSVEIQIIQTQTFIINLILYKLTNRNRNLNINMKIDKQAVCKFLKKLNKQLLSRYTEMKSQFERNPPSNNEIKKKFLEWKCKYDELVVSTLKQCQDIDEKNFDFKQFIVSMTDELGGDQEFLELLKNVNNSIESLKDFIRINLVKDPTIYETTTA